mgnify:CR=1 FL=1
MPDAATDVVTPPRDVAMPSDAAGVAFRVWAPAAQSASVVHGAPRPS